MDDTNGHGMKYANKYITVKNYEEFLTQIHMNDEVRTRYWYDMVCWAEHHRAAINKRLVRYRNKKRAKQAADEEAAKKAAEAAAEAAKNPVPALTVSNTPRVINLYQGDAKRRSSTLSIPENTLMPRTLR